MIYYVIYLPLLDENITNKRHTTEGAQYPL